MKVAMKVAIQNGYAFPRALRLVQSQDFQRVFKQTQFRSSDRLLSVLARESEQSHARLGLAVAKKKIKTAVARHRVKRLVRESFRLHQYEIQALDIVVLAQAAAAVADKAQLLKSLEKHWERLSDQCKRSRCS